MNFNMFNKHFNLTLKREHAIKYILQQKNSISQLLLQVLEVKIVSLSIRAMINSNNKKL